MGATPSLAATRLRSASKTEKIGSLLKIGDMMRHRVPDFRSTLSKICPKSISKSWTPLCFFCGDGLQTGPTVILKKGSCRGQGLLLDLVPLR